MNGKECRPRTKLQGEIGTLKLNASRGIQIHHNIRFPSLDALNACKQAPVFMNSARKDNIAFIIHIYQTLSRAPGKKRLATGEKHQQEQLSSRKDVQENTLLLVAHCWRVALHATLQEEVPQGRLVALEYQPTNCESFQYGLPTLVVVTVV
jgi:hypothetical protein